MKKRVDFDTLPKWAQKNIGDYGHGDAAGWIWCQKCETLASFGVMGHGVPRMFLKRLLACPSCGKRRSTVTTPERHKAGF